MGGLNALSYLLIPDFILNNKVNIDPDLLIKTIELVNSHLLPYKEVILDGQNNKGPYHSLFYPGWGHRIHNRNTSTNTNGENPRPTHSPQHKEFSQ